MWLAYSNDMAKPKSKDPIKRESTRLTCVATTGGQTTNKSEFWKEMIIDLMGSQIEAEGFEPEVLEGAGEVLKRTELVTVDAGEERGGASTAPECLNLLFGAGFILKNVFLKRGIFLMARA